MSASAQAPVPVSAAIPALFVSHGAPLFALDAGTTGPALTQWGQSLKSQYPGLREQMHQRHPGAMVKGACGVTLGGHASGLQQAQHLLRQRG